MITIMFLCAGCCSYYCSLMNIAIDITVIVELAKDSFSLVHMRVYSVQHLQLVKVQSLVSVTLNFDLLQSYGTQIRYMTL